MSVPTMSLMSFLCGSTIALEDVFSIRKKLQMFWIATESVIANMIKNRNVLSFSVRNGSNEPSIYKSVDAIANLIYSDAPVSRASCGSSPYPTTSFSIFSNFGEYALGTFLRYIFNYKHLIHTQIVPLIIHLPEWLNNKWDKAKYPLEWLIQKFAPVPEWGE